MAGLMDSSKKGKKLRKYHGRYPLMLHPPPANTHLSHHYQIPTIYGMYPFYHQSPAASLPAPHYSMMQPAGTSHIPAFNTPQMAGWQLLPPSYVPQLTPASIQPILHYPSPPPAPPNHYQLLLKELIDAAGMKRRPTKVVPFITEDNSDSEDSTEEEGADRHVHFTDHMTSRHTRSGLVHTLTETVASEIIFKFLLQQLLEDQEVTTDHTSIDEVINGGGKTGGKTNTTINHDREPGDNNSTNDGDITMDTELAGSSGMANSITEYMLRGEHMDNVCVHTYHALWRQLHYHT